MKLNGIDFGPIWGAAGVQGMFGGMNGEEYRHHRIYRMCFPGRFTFKGVTFTTKTFTADYNRGNMPLRKNGCTPRKLFPKCIKVSFRKGLALNAVGLTNFGARFYFEQGIWQKRPEPFVLSFACVGEKRQDRISEIIRFVKIALEYLRSFKAPVALQINFSCPNTGHDLKELVREVIEILSIADDLRMIGNYRVPLIPKFNILVPPEKVAEIADHSLVAAVCVSNSIPWGQLPERIDWKGLFGSDVSPLAKYKFGNGGLSGAPITAPVRDWVEGYCSLGPAKQLNAGGGLMCRRDVKNINVAPQSKPNPVGSVFVGAAAMVRPWNLDEITSEAYAQFGSKQSD